MFIEVKNVEKMMEIGKSIGSVLYGGEIIELIGDIGAGKTTLTKGIAIGLDIDDYVQSPSFSISRIYDGRSNITLAHYDFYRLDDAGIMSIELQELIQAPNKVIVIEWAEVVKDVLPEDRLSIEILTLSDNSRKLKISSGGVVSGKLIDRIKV